MGVSGSPRTLPHKSPRPTSGINLPDRMFNPIGGEIIIDEFDDHTIDSAWTRVDAISSSHLTWTESGGVMSAAHDATADTAGYWHALMRPLPAGATYPITIETYIHASFQYNTNYIMIGTAFSDGVTPGAGNQCVFMPYPNSTSEGSYAYDMRDCNNWNSNTQIYNSGLYGTLGTGSYIRQHYDGANSYHVSWSTDGISWISGTSQTSTFTPTHVGLIITNWGGAYPFQGTWEYFRVYDVENPAGDEDTL